MGRIAAARGRPVTGNRPMPPLLPTIERTIQRCPADPGLSRLVRRGFPMVFTIAVDLVGFSHSHP
jgi:hypothetical protein